MTLRPCIVCGEPSASARCPQHTPHRRKANASARGYDRTWRKLSERARRLQPFCTDCGSTEDLQTDHSPQAWQRKAEGLAIRLADVDVLCGHCNRTRGAARGDAPKHPGATPGCKSKFQLLTFGPLTKSKQHLPQGFLGFGTCVPLAHQHKLECEFPHCHEVRKQPWLHYVVGPVENLVDRFSRARPERRSFKNVDSKKEQRLEKRPHRVRRVLISFVRHSWSLA